MTLRHMTVKPPKIGETITCNEQKFEVLDVKPEIGYRPKRWVIEIKRKEKNK